MKFIFRAKDQEGKLKEGKVEAINRDLAVQVLQKNNLVPIYVAKEEGDTPQILKELQRTWNNVGQRDLAVFFRELATLVGARVPIVSALRAIMEQADNKLLRITIKEIANNVEEGMTLSESLGRHKDIFSPLVINMVKAGEISGTLQKSVDYIADNLEKNYRLTSKVKGALFYPAFVIGACGIVGFLVMTVILPKLTGVIRDMGMTVPWYTVAIMAVGDFMQVYWWAVLLIILGGIGGFIYYIKTEAGHKEWDHVSIKLPIFGKLLRYVYLARLTGNLGILISGGIPIVRALLVVGEIVNNEVYKSIIVKSAETVKTGGSISSVFERTSYIPSVVSQMVRIGEETGKLSEILANISEFYESETDNLTRNMSALIEPILIVILGIGVAFLVFAILLPIYNVVGQIE
jgi:type II secretory pathway component PulF